MNNIKAEQMTSDNGNKIANQFIIWTDEGCYFQSYNTIIAFRSKNGEITLNDGDCGGYSWDCTRTTGKYRNQFLGEGVEETRKKVKSGEYKLANLNK